MADLIKKIHVLYGDSKKKKVMTVSAWQDTRQRATKDISSEENVLQ